MSELRNGNVFLIPGSLNKSPKIYSSYNKAEQNLLDNIRALKTCSFFYDITCVQIDTQQIKKTNYNGTVEIKNKKKYITINRDPKNQSNCKKTHTEELILDLD